MKYKILVWETNPFLRTPADTVENFGLDISKLARDMKLVCHEEDGVGLAGPQIGVMQRVIYTTQRKKTPKWLKYLSDQIMINPEIIWHSDTSNIDVEWCLSLPGIEGKVKRYNQVKVRFFEPSGKELVKTYKWFDARIIQHEVDHLDGILFIDKAENVWRLKG